MDEEFQWLREEVARATNSTICSTISRNDITPNVLDKFSNRVAQERAEQVEAARGRVTYTQWLESTYSSSTW